ncbi:hypothetical protein EMCRGX_G025647 [Ephydatia muelleri]
MVAAKTFFFDTGPGCEKRYAFSTEKASDLYELVANINQGNLQDQASNKKSNGTVPSSARPSMDGRRQFTKIPRKPSQSNVDSSHSFLTESTCDPDVISPKSSMLPTIHVPNPWPNYVNLELGPKLTIKPKLVDPPHAVSHSTISYGRDGYHSCELKSLCSSLPSSGLSCALHYPDLGYPVLFTTLIWAILCSSLLPSSGLSCALHYPHLGYPVLFTTLIWAILCSSLPSSGLSCALHYPHLGYPVLFTTLIWAILCSSLPSSRYT